MDILIEKKLKELRGQPRSRIEEEIENYPLNLKEKIFNRVPDTEFYATSDEFVEEIN